MELQKDSDNRPYIEIGNIRLTYIPAGDKSSEVILFQARAEDGSQPEKGAEVPIQSPKEFYSLVSALCQVYVEGRAQQ